MIGFVIKTGEKGCEVIIMKDSTAESFKIVQNKGKGLAFLQVLVELMAGFEPATSSLPKKE